MLNFRAVKLVVKLVRVLAIAVLVLIGMIWGKLGDLVNVRRIPSRR